jgi:hypothetical protein
LAAKAVGNKSVNGLMIACDDKSGRQKKCNNQAMTGESKAGISGGGNGDSDGIGGGSGG